MFRHLNTQPRKEFYKISLDYLISSMFQLPRSLDFLQDWKDADVIIKLWLSVKDGGTENIRQVK